MAGLPPFISLPGVPGIPGLGLPLPKVGGSDKSGSFGELFDQKLETGGSGLNSPSSSLAQPFEAPHSIGTTQAIESLGKPLGAFLDSVNTLQFQAEGLKTELATGGDVELHEVMIAAEKASLGVELTMQIRNKLVDAYQEVMRMSV